MKYRCLLTAVLAFASVASAAEQKWVKATSANFEVYTTAGEKKAREAILYFEQVHSFFQRAFNATSSGKGRVRIVAFQSAKEYKPYQLYDRTAYAGGGRDRDEIVMQSVSEENYPTAVHEYVHILLKPVKNMPLWLNEGLAQLYQTLHPSGKRVLVGELLPGGIYTLQQGNWLDLGTLCAVDHNSPYYTTDHSKVSVFYTESWALTHMLFLSDQYRLKYRDFTRLIVAGTAPADAFQKAFDRPMREVLADLRAYVRGDRFKGLYFDVALEKSAESPEIQPVTPLDSGLVLANILADLNKTGEARQAYLKLASENPASPEVPEALGYLAWRKGDHSEVRAEFAKAVELGSRNARMYFEYAAMAGQAGDSGKLQIKLLRKAVELDPDYYEARLHLGFQLTSESDYAGALAEFAHLKKVEPEHAFAFFQAVAYAAYRTGDKEGARANAKRAAEVAPGPAEKAQVEQLIEALDQHPGERMRTMAEPEPEPEPEKPEKALHQHETVVVPQLPKRIPLSAVEGTLDQIDCLGTTARLRITAAGRPVRLLIDKPSAIEVRGAKAGSFTMTCGPQKAHSAVRVEFEPKVNDQLGTTGLVRVLEMK
jgi:tetratricopeptide (TPR) repeat protein